MTKILLSGFLILSFSFAALACKPAPLTRTDCGRPTVQLNYKNYIRLLKAVMSYQKSLTRGIIHPQNSNSCFNNGFANHYTMELKHFMDDHNRLACREQVERVKASIQSLISESSQEFLAVRSSGAQNELRRKAKLIEIQIETVLK